MVQSSALAVVRGLLLLGFAVTLSACGFHLRGSGVYPFSSIYVQPPTPDAPIVADIVAGLMRSGVHVQRSPEGADLIARIVQVAFEKRVLSLSGDGRAREFELEYLLRYEFVDAKGLAWGEPAEIILRRDFSYATSQTLAKETEERQLVRDMQLDAAAQILRRLQAVKRPQ